MLALEPGSEAAVLYSRLGHVFSGPGGGCRVYRSDPVSLVCLTLSSPMGIRRIGFIASHVISNNVSPKPGSTFCFGEMFPQGSQNQDEWPARLFLLYPVSHGNIHILVLLGT